MTPSPNPAPEPAPEKSATPRMSAALKQCEQDTTKVTFRDLGTLYNAGQDLERDLAQARAELAEAKKNLGFHKGLADAVSALNVQADDTIKALREALEGYVYKFGNCGDVYRRAISALASTQEDAP